MQTGVLAALVRLDRNCMHAVAEPPACIVHAEVCVPTTKRCRFRCISFPKTNWPAQVFDQVAPANTHTSPALIAKCSTLAVQEDNIAICVRCRSGQQIQLQTSAQLPVHVLVQAVQQRIPPRDYVGYLASNGDELISHHTLATCDIQDEDVLDWVTHSEPTRIIDISVFIEGASPRPVSLRYGNTCLVDTVIQGLHAVLPPREAIGFFVLDGVQLQPELTLAASTPLTNIVLHWVSYLMNGCTGVDATR